jgi:hypothetical protein
MKTYGEAEVQIQSYLTSVPAESDKFQASTVLPM